MSYSFRRLLGLWEADRSEPTANPANIVGAPEAERTQRQGHAPSTGVDCMQRQLGRAFGEDTQDRSEHRQSNAIVLS